MYRQHFGLTHGPLGKHTLMLWDDGQLTPIRERGLFADEEGFDDELNF